MTVSVTATAIEVATVGAMVAAGMREGGGRGVGPSEKGVRSFIAVALPEVLRVDILNAAKSLATALPDVRWSRKVENLHVTMKFLGPVAPARLQEMVVALGSELGKRNQTGGFDVRVRGLGAFPGAGRATTIWAGVEDDGGRLDAVAQAVERVARRLGVGEVDAGKDEPRKFRPHVTVGRCKDGVDARAALDSWRDHLFGTAAVAALDVYESRLSPLGSTYVLRGRAALGGDAAISIF